jgi:AcrR family transcriptional regulator
MTDEPSRTAGDGGSLTSSRRGKLPPGPGMPAEEVAAHQRVRIHAAMVDIVAEEGYRSVKVRDIVRRAGVSTRAFYEHFDSKEECFLRTYELIARRATQRIIAAQAGDTKWHDRPRLVLEAFARELESGPAAAHLTLVEAYAAGADSLEQAWRFERTFEAMFAEGLARAPDGVVVPPLVIEGIVAGVARVARTRLLAGKAGKLHDLNDELVEWALCYVDDATASLGELDKGSVWRNTMLESQGALLGSPGNDGWPKTGDRALLLRAVAKLVVADGYRKLTPSRIRAAAGVSRKEFDANFDGVESCYLAALEQHAEEALSQAARAQTAGRTWSGGIYRSIAALCEQVAADAFLAGVCLGGGSSLGPGIGRAQMRLITAVADQLTAGVPHENRPSELVLEASSGAVWAVFHRHVARALSHTQPQVAATLSFIALAPAVGASAAVAAIRREQAE